MKKLFLVSLFLMLIFGLCNPVSALITTENVDKDTFQYEVPYAFATTDMGAAQTVAEITVSPAVSGYYYTIPRSGRLVGISVAANTAVTSGGATFDVTINSYVTGIQTVLQSGTARTAVGNSGAGGTTYAYMRQDRSETAASRGFRVSSDRASYHNAENSFGKATPLVAGDRIGVKVTTSSGFAPMTSDYFVVIYVLE
jgi:hypothetical protein